MHKGRLANNRFLKGKKTIVQECLTKSKWAKTVLETADVKKYSERLILKSVKQLILFKNQNVGLGL